MLKSVKCYALTIHEATNQPPCRVSGLILTLLPFGCIIEIPTDNVSFKFSLFQTKVLSYHTSQGTIAVQWATVVILL